MGPEIAELERRLAASSPTSPTPSPARRERTRSPCRSWRGALRPGDAVFCPSFTFAATGEVVAWLGATPVFVDVDPVRRGAWTSPRAWTARSREVRADGRADAPRVGDRGRPVRPGRRLPRHPYAVCDAHGMKLISDAAQGFGSTLRRAALGRLGGRGGDLVLPGQAAGLLRRRRRHADRRTPALDAAAPLAAQPRRQRRGPLRQRGRGHERAAGHDPGRDPDREAGHLHRTRSRRGAGSPRATRDALGRRPHRARRFPEGVVSTWAQYTVLLPEAGRARGLHGFACASGRRAKRGVLSAADAPADRLSPPPCRGRHGCPCPRTSPRASSPCPCTPI